MLRVILPYLIMSMCQDGFAISIDCSDAYLEPTKCERVQCLENHQTFIGTWSGPMESLVDFGPAPIYRKFHNEIRYDSSDCLRNLENGETFIIGRRTDRYEAFQDKPAMTEQQLLITGKTKDNEPFLRTIDLTTRKKESFNLVHKNDVAVLSIWKLQGVQEGVPFVVETIDAKDWTVKDPTSEHRRNVTVTLESGGYKRVLVRGYHTKH